MFLTQKLSIPLNFFAMMNIVLCLLHRELVVQPVDLINSSYGDLSDNDIGVQSKVTGILKEISEN